MFPYNQQFQQFQNPAQYQPAYQPPQLMFPYNQQFQNPAQFQPAYQPAQNTEMKKPSKKKKITMPMPKPKGTRFDINPPQPMPMYSVQQQIVPPFNPYGYNQYPMQPGYGSYMNSFYHPMQSPSKQQSMSHQPLGFNFREKPKPVHEVIDLSEDEEEDHKVSKNNSSKSKRSKYFGLKVPKKCLRKDCDRNCREFVIKDYTSDFHGLGFTKCFGTSGKFDDDSHFQWWYEYNYARLESRGEIPSEKEAKEVRAQDPAVKAGLSDVCLCGFFSDIQINSTGDKKAVFICHEKSCNRFKDASKAVEYDKDQKPTNPLKRTRDGDFEDDQHPLLKKLKTE